MPLFIVYSLDSGSKETEDNDQQAGSEEEEKYIALPGSMRKIVLARAS
jgi:hypothetical protein